MAVYHNNDYMLDLCVRMAHHSTAIEGNTLSQNETSSIILDDFIPRAVKEREYYEVRNYKNIIPALKYYLDMKQGINNNLIKDFNKIIMENLLYNNGNFKNTPNLIIGATFEPTKPYLVPIELEDLKNNLYYRIEHAENDDEKLKAILDYHIGFERIHPFSDGNGRTGRLLMIYSCLEQNIAPVVIQKEQKSLYIQCLRERDIDMFFAFAKELQQAELKRINIFLSNELSNHIDSNDSSALESIEQNGLSLTDSDSKADNVSDDHNRNINKRRM